MKKLTSALVIAATLISSSAYSATDVDICASVQKFSASVMRHRQQGDSFSRMMKVVSASDHPEVKSKIIISAFDRPRYGSEKYVRESISNFANDMAVSCYKVRTSK